MADYDSGNDRYDPGSYPVNDVAPVDTGLYSPPSPDEQRSADVSQYYSDYGSPAPADYQQDAPPSSAQLGMTAREAYNFVPPPAYYSPEDEIQQKASADLFSGLGSAVRGVTDAVGGALQTDKDVVQGGLGNLVAAYFPGSPQDIAYKDAMNRIVNDPRNANADWTDWRTMAQAQMQAGRESWDRVPDVPLLKGAVEAAVDPVNLAFAGGGEALRAGRGVAELAGAAGRDVAEGAGRAAVDLLRPSTLVHAAGPEEASNAAKSIEELAGSKIGDAAHAADVAYLKELGDRAVGGTATPEDLAVLKGAAKKADALEASGEAKKASEIRQALGIEEPPTRGTPLTGGADKGFVPTGAGAYPGTNLERMLAEGSDQSRAGLADRLAEQSGQKSAATDEFNQGLAKDIATRSAVREPEVPVSEIARQQGLTKGENGMWQDSRGNLFTDEAVRSEGPNKFYGDVVDTKGVAGPTEDLKVSAETRAAMEERDTALKGSGQKFEDLTPGAQARLNLMYGVSKDPDPEISFVGRVLSPVTNVSNAMRTAMTSWDLSMGRQAAGLLGEAPASVGRGLKAQFEGMRMTESEFRDATAKLVAQVDAAGGRKLAIGGPGSFHEEKYVGSNLVEGLPGVKGSEQAYTHGLNVARSDAFLTGVKSMEEAAGRSLTQEEKDQFASHINHLTGRGDVPEGMENAFNMINGVFFAPRYRISRAQVATDFANSAIGVMKDVGTALINHEPLALNPVDKKILEGTAKYFASIESVMRAAQLSEHLLGREDTYSDVGTPDPFGLTDSLPGHEDPTATGFGKLDVGEPGSPGAIAAAAGEFVGLGTQSYQGKDQQSETVKVDPWSGFGPEIRTAFREWRNLQGLWADINNEKGPEGAHTFGSDALKYGRQGLSPAANLIATAYPQNKPGSQYYGANAIGQKVGASDYTATDFQRNPLMQSSIPLAFQGALQDTGLPYPGKEGPLLGPSTAMPGEDVTTSTGAGFGGGTRGAGTFGGKTNIFGGKP